MIIYLELWRKMSLLKLDLLNSCQTDAFSVSQKVIKMFPQTKYQREPQIRAGGGE